MAYTLPVSINGLITSTTCTSQAQIDSCYTSSPNGCCSGDYWVDYPEVTLVDVTCTGVCDNFNQIAPPGLHDNVNCIPPGTCCSNGKYTLKGAFTVDGGAVLNYNFQITDSNPQYEIYENQTFTFSFDPVEDYGCNPNLPACAALAAGIANCESTNLDVSTYLMSYGCADDTADNGSSSNPGCPDSSGVPDPNITDCCTYPPSYDVIISEVFLKDDEGDEAVSDYQVKIPQWIELTNVTNTDIDISDYWIESINSDGDRISLSPLSGIDGYTENNNNGFIYKSIMKSKDNSPIHNYYCPSNSPHEYYNFSDCNDNCDDTCIFVRHGDKYVVISNHEENNYGVFNSSGEFSPNLSFGDLINDIEGDLETLENEWVGINATLLPLNISFTDFKLDKQIQVVDNECTSTPWIDYRNQHAGEVHGSGKIILWKSNPDESYFPQMESIFCYDRTISGTYPKGYPLEYNSHNPGAIPLIEHITDLNNWDLDDTNSAPLLKTGSSLNRIYSFLNYSGSEIDFIEPNASNNQETTLPPEFDFADNYGTPIDVNQIYSTSILSGWCDDFTQEDLNINEADCDGTWYKVCTDVDALNYICRRDEFVFNTDICPSGVATQPEQLPLWVLDDEENNNNSCYYQLVNDCTHSNANNYWCDESGDGQEDLCTGGEINQDCCTGLADTMDNSCSSPCVVDDGSCMWDVYLYFGDVEHSTNTLTFKMWNPRPVDEINQITLDGIKVTSCEPPNANWTCDFEHTGLPDNPQSLITLNQTISIPLPTPSSYGDFPCSDSTCTVGNTLFTVTYESLIDDVNQDDNQTLNIRNNSLSFSIDQTSPIITFSTNESGGFNIIDTDTLSTDCNGHPYRTGDAHTATDNCNQCAASDYSDGCWYNDNGETCTYCYEQCSDTLVSGTCHSCAGCDGIPGSGKIYDDTGNCVEGPEPLNGDWFLCSDGTTQCNPTSGTACSNTPTNCTLWSCDNGVCVNTNKCDSSGACGSGNLWWDCNGGCSCPTDDQYSMACNYTIDNCTNCHQNGYSSGGTGIWTNADCLVAHGNVQYPNPSNLHACCDCASVVNGSNTNNSCNWGTATYSCGNPPPCPDGYDCTLENGTTTNGVPVWYLDSDSDGIGCPPSLDDGGGLIGGQQSQCTQPAGYANKASGVETTALNCECPNQTWNACGQCDPTYTTTDCQDCAGNVAPCDGGSVDPGQAWTDQCNSWVREDLCGVCGGTCWSTEWTQWPNGTGLTTCPSSTCTCCDCEGTPNGTATLNCNGDCECSDSWTLGDYAGHNAVCGGTQYDECGVCNGQGRSKDCQGTCAPGDNVSTDEGCGAGEGYNIIAGACQTHLGSCNEVTADGSSPGDDTTPLTNCGRDECGICEGDGTTTYYYDTDGDGTSNCEVEQEFCPYDDTTGWNNTCDNDEDETCFSNEFDECGVCDGDNSSCSDCFNVPNGTNEIDDCGICSCIGDNCGGNNYVANSSKDACGVCQNQGGNETGTCYSGTFNTGVPCKQLGNNPNLSDCPYPTFCFVVGDDADCAGVCSGTALTDECGKCICGDFQDPVVSDTGGLCLDLYWNSFCLDNCGIPNGNNATNVGCGCNYGSSSNGPSPDQYYFDEDGDSLGCGSASTLCLSQGDTIVNVGTVYPLVSSMSGSWVTNNDDGQCDCYSNDTDDCGVCAGDNTSCSGCLDANACSTSGTTDCANPPVKDGTDYSCCDYTSCCTNGNGTTEGTGSCVCYDTFCGPQCQYSVDDCGYCITGTSDYTPYNLGGNYLGQVTVAGETKDCAGVCDGPHTTDCGGQCECSGSWTTKEEHNLACDGTHQYDDCGYCRDGSTDYNSTVDCRGITGDLICSDGTDGAINQTIIYSGIPDDVDPFSWSCSSHPNTNCTDNAMVVTDIVDNLGNPGKEVSGVSCTKMELEGNDTDPCLSNNNGLRIINVDHTIGGLIPGEELVLSFRYWSENNRKVATSLYASGSPSYRCHLGCNSAASCFANDQADAWVDYTITGTAAEQSVLCQEKAIALGVDWWAGDYLYWNYNSDSPWGTESEPDGDGWRNVTARWIIPHWYDPDYADDNIRIYLRDGSHYSVNSYENNSYRFSNVELIRTSGCTDYLEPCGTNGYCVDVACDTGDYDHSTNNCGDCVSSTDYCCVQGCDSSWYHGYDQSGSQCVDDGHPNDGRYPENDVCGICDGDGSTCAPEFSFGTFNTSTGKLPVRITNTTEISHITQIHFNLFSKPGDDPITIGSVSKIHPNINTVVVNSPTDEGDYLQYQVQMTTNTPIPIGTDTELFTLDLLVNGASWSPNYNSFYIDFYNLTAEYGGTYVYRDSAGDTYLDTSLHNVVSYGAPLYISYGCLDPYAGNCTSVDNCGCDYTLDIFECDYVHYQPECEYPTFDITHFEVGGTKTEVLSQNEHFCNATDVYNNTCNDFFDYGLSHTPSPYINSFNGQALEFNVFNQDNAVQHNMSTFKYDIDYDFTTNLSYDRGSGDPYTITSNSASAINTLVGRGVFGINGPNTFNLDDCGGGAGTCYNTYSFTDVNDITGTENHVVLSNSTWESSYWDSATACGGDPCPYSGTNYVTIWWPYNWYELTDPLTGATMTGPRYKRQVAVNLKRYGCQDSDNSTCNYSNRYSNGCFDSNGDETCCLYKSELYNTTYNCCLPGLKDSCNYCPEDTLTQNGATEYSVHGVGQITYYGDPDLDLQGCGEITNSNCPHIDPGNGWYHCREGQGCNVECSGTCNNDIVYSLWPSRATLDLIGDQYCDCVAPDGTPGAFDTWCDGDCVEVCTNNMMTEEQFLGGYTEYGITDFVGEDILGTPINEFTVWNNTTEGASSEILEGDSESFTIQINDGGLDRNHVQVFPSYPSNIPLDEGDVYRVIFKILSTIDRTINVRLIEHSNGEDWDEDGTSWETYGLNENFEVTANNDKNKVYEFIANSQVTKPSTGQGNPHASLRFGLGGDNLPPHQVIISDVRVIHMSRDEIVRSTDCNSTYPQNGFCVQDENGTGVCRYVDDCGLCYNNGPNGISVPLENNSIINIASGEGTNQDCNGVCFPYTEQFESSWDFPYDNNFGSYIDDCGVCSGTTTEHEAGEDIDECGSCFGTCLVQPDDLTNVLGLGTITPDSDGNCYIWEGGCYDCASNNVGSGGDPIVDFDVCGVCGGDGYDDVVNECCSTEGQPYYNGVADCSGQCGGTNEVDDWGNCCPPADFRTVYPDLDYTTTGTGECRTGTPSFDGCTGEIGVCQGGAEEEYTCTNAVEGDCTCEDGGTFYPVTTLRICVGNLSDENNVYYGGTVDGLPSITQPDINSIGTNISDFTGHFYLSTDFCPGYGPDECGECWDTPGEVNNNKDCNGTCTCNDLGEECQYKLDECGVCYDSYAIDPPNDCGFKCLDSEANNYDSSSPSLDCVNVLNGGDFTCCSYNFDVPLYATGHCDNDPSIECIDGSQCGGGVCRYVVTVNDQVDSNFPTILKWSYDPGQNMGMGYEEGVEKFAIYRSVDLGATWYSLGDVLSDFYTYEKVSATEVNYQFTDTFVDGTNDIDWSAVTDVSYYIVSTGGLGIEAQSEIVTVSNDHYSPTMTASVVKPIGGDSESWSSPNCSGDSPDVQSCDWNFTKDDKIWLKIQYSFIPFNINRDFSIEFIGNGWTETPSLNQLGELPTWTNGSDGTSTGNWYCPTPFGRWVDGDGNDKQFLSQSDCENGIDDWPGCYWSEGDIDDDTRKVGCVQYYDKYFDITDVVWNNATISDHTNYPSTGILPIYGELNYPTLGVMYDNVTFSIITKQGCIDEPIIDGEGVWINGACICDTCSNMCGSCDSNGITDYYSCTDDSSSVFESYCDSTHHLLNSPNECLVSLDSKSAFYDPQASWDHCVDGNGNIKINFECTNDTQCVEFAINQGDWEGSVDDAKCASSCRYPVIGCQDDGRVDNLAPNGTFYENNQGSFGHVLDETYKCENSNGNILDFGKDSTCSRTINGVVGICVGSSGDVLLEYSNEAFCLDSSNDFDWPRTFVTDIDCVTECLLSPSPAVNFLYGSTYDPYNECLYGGCLDPDAINYALRDFTLSADYGCEGNGCNTWITNGGCVLPFDYMLQIKYYENQTLKVDEVGVELLKDENAHCEIEGVESEEIFTETQCDNAGGDWIIDYLILRKPILGSFTCNGVNDSESGGLPCQFLPEDCNFNPQDCTESTWDDNDLRVIVTGGQGWNCLGDDSGLLYTTYNECREECIQYEILPTNEYCISKEEYGTEYDVLCGDLTDGQSCEDYIASSGTGTGQSVCDFITEWPSDEECELFSCEGFEEFGQYGASCTSSGEPCGPDNDGDGVLDGVCVYGCGECNSINQRGASWYTTEEYPFNYSVFDLSDGVCNSTIAPFGYTTPEEWNDLCDGMGGGWHDYALSDGGEILYSDQDCQETGDECVRIDPYEAGYGYTPDDLTEITRFYEVTVTDPNKNSIDPNGDGFTHVQRTKRLWVKWVRNDYPLVINGLNTGGTLQDVSTTGITLRVGQEEDRLYTVDFTDPENSNNNAYDVPTFTMYYSSNTEEDLPLNINITPEGTLFIGSPESVGHWTVTIYANQTPFETPPEDLRLYWKGIPTTCTCDPHLETMTCSCVKYEFEISSIDTSGPEGVVVPVLVSSFGVSPDTYLFSVSGGDLRERLYWDDEVGNTGVYDFPNPNYGGWLSKNAAMYSSDGSCDTLHYESNTESPNNQYDKLNCETYGVCVENSGTCSNGESDVTIGECVTYGNCLSHYEDPHYPMQITSDECTSLGVCYESGCVETGTCSVTTSTPCTADDDCPSGEICDPPPVCETIGMSCCFDEDCPDYCLGIEESVCDGLGGTWEAFDWEAHEFNAYIIHDRQEAQCTDGTWIGYNWLGSGIEPDFNPGGTDTHDTIWRYDLSIYHCVDENGEEVDYEDCNEYEGRCSDCQFELEDGTSCNQIDNRLDCENDEDSEGAGGIWITTKAQLIDGYPKTWRDWTIAYPFNEYGLDWYYPPIQSLPTDPPEVYVESGNTFTNRYVCPDGSYCPGYGSDYGIDEPDECQLPWPDGTIIDGVDYSGTTDCVRACEHPDNWPCTGDGNTREGNWVKDLLMYGHTHRFSEVGTYKVVMQAFDTYWSSVPDDDVSGGTETGYNAKRLDINYVIPIKQTLPKRYLPWQGVNIPETLNVPLNNSRRRIESVDLDERPQLGCFIYRETDDGYEDLVRWDSVASGSYISPFDQTVVHGGAGDFIPDVDARTPMSFTGESYRLSGNYSTVFEYYDPKLQPEHYNETTAGTEVQFYFYAREYGNGIMFEEKDAFEDLVYNENLYVGFIDWGDGTSMEYDTEPFQLGYDSVLTHNYERPGIYEMTGRMFRVVRYNPADCESYCQDACSGFNVWPLYEETESYVSCLYACGDECDEVGIPEELAQVGRVMGIDKHHKFLVRFKVSKNIGYENEHEQVGGAGYTFIPYNDSTPFVGGISEDSIYFKSIKRQLGYVGDEQNPFKLNFQNYNDRLESEYALALLKEDYIGEEMSKFTGSGAHIFSFNEQIQSDDKIKTYVYENSNDVPLQLSSSLVQGFFSGSVDQYGSLNNPSSTVQINQGDFQKYSEFGNHIGNIDMSQNRYFTKPIDMWQMLGFNCDIYSAVDTIPLNNPEAGMNYRNHSQDVGNTTEVLAPDGTNTATKLFDVSSTTDTNDIRFGYKFKITKDGLGKGLNYNGLSSLSDHYNPNLKEGQTYTFSTYVYIPEGNQVGEDLDQPEFRMNANQVCNNSDWAQHGNNQGNGIITYGDPTTSQYCITQEFLDQTPNGIVDKEWCNTFLEEECDMGIFCEWDGAECVPNDSSAIEHYSCYQGCYTIDGGIANQDNQWDYQGDVTYAGHRTVDISNTINADMIGEWHRIYGTFTTQDIDLFGQYINVQIVSPFGRPGGDQPGNTSDVLYVWGAQLELGDTLSPYTIEDIDYTDCIESYGGNPSSDRYWKNIIPKDFTIEDRIGVSLNQQSFLNNELVNSDIVLNPNPYFSDFEFIEKDSVEEYDGIKMIKITHLENDKNETAGSSINFNDPQSSGQFIGNYTWEEGKTYIISCKAFYEGTINDSYSPQVRFIDENGYQEIQFLTFYNEYNYVPYEFEYVYNPNGDTQSLGFLGINQNSSIYVWDLSIKEKTNLITEELIIDEESDQSWIDGYYYPVLPRVDRFGNFTQIMQGSGRIPFGPPNRMWNEKDLTSPVTDSNYKDSSLLIDTDLNQSISGLSEDKSGNENIGLGVGDYRIEFDDGRKPERNPIIIESKNTSDEKAF